MKSGISLTDLAKEIERRAASKRDFVAPVTKVSFDEQANLVMPNLPALPVNGVAHNQIAEYTKIPGAYYKRMLAESPALLAQNINQWMPAEDQDRRMVRTLDGQVRAFLSDKYRALENEDLAEAVLPVLLERDLIIMSSQITSTRLYIKAVDRRILKDIPTGRSLGDGSHVFFDTISPAIIISNSEVGHGALSIETGVFTKFCTNLAMIGGSTRRYHTGTKAELSDEVYALLTDKTKKLTDAAIWSQTRDLVASAFDQAVFDANVKKLEESTEDKIEGDVVEVVEVLANRMDFTQGERKGILQHLIQGGDLTRYGVHGAITRFSQDVDDYDRATELERAGGKVIELPKGDWQRILAEAA